MGGGEGGEMDERIVGRKGKRRGEGGGGLRWFVRVSGRYTKVMSTHVSPGVNTHH